MRSAGSFLLDSRALSIAMALLLAALAGCSSDSSTNVKVTPSVDQDVAESIVSDIGANDGGAIDQAGDLLALTGPLAPGAMTAALPEVAVPSATYNDTTGIWTISISRINGQPGDLYYANVQRVYNLQFLNQAAVPQKFWVVGADTAYTASFVIVSGSGEHHTPRLSQVLTGLSGNWTATGVNTDTVTVNGSYSRSARDTIKTYGAVRILDHSLQLQLVNLRGPRGSRLDVYRKVSGTITGTYTADITFVSGAEYSERHVTRTFTITLVNGNATIVINGARYIGNVSTGSLNAG